MTIEIVEHGFRLSIVALRAPLVIKWVGGTKVWIR